MDTSFINISIDKIHILCRLKFENVFLTFLNYLGKTHIKKSVLFSGRTTKGVGRLT